ncbi:MAG: T9SS type A sorting domain-containing protein, partial [Flavobacteriales bacterium]
GGTGGTQGQACAVDESNHVYLAGSTFSPNGIASEGHQNMHGGDWDAYLAKFDRTGPFDGIVSLQDLEQSFTIWPNPSVGDRFFLQTQGSGLADVQIFDGLGKLQRKLKLQLTPSQAPVEVALRSELAKGLYMVRLTMEGRSSVAPLMIE